MNLEIVSIIVSFLTVVLSVFSIIYSSAYKRGKIEKRLEKLEQDNDYITEEIRKLHDNVIQISTIIQIKMKGVNNVFSNKYSPRRLNTLGEKMFQDMDGDAFLEENKDRFFALIDSNQPKAALDVENLSLWACTSLIDEEVFIPIKNFVYNCPLQKDLNGNDVEFTLEDACFVLSLPLRDKYLAAHPDLNA